MLKIWFTINLLVNVVSGIIEKSDFYSYGIAANDNILASRDDASTRVPISFEYPFFGSTYQEVHISTNGILSFGAGYTSYSPSPFPLIEMHAVAAYWTDSDPSKGGRVFYRETTNRTVLGKISQEIKFRLINYNTFNAEWALVVTYDQVPPFSCGCNTSCSSNVIYQTVLTSDGVNSFAIFNFNHLGYPTASGNCVNFAQVGFNAGDGKRFFLMPNSNTAKISETALFQSNVGVPGKWIFSTDANDIIEQCNTKGQLEIFPRKILYFGGQELKLSGVCYEQNSSNVSVLFDDAPVLCKFGQWKYLLCRVPLLKKLGKIAVSLKYNSITYKSFIISVGRDDNTVVENINEFRNEINLDDNITIEWDPSNHDQQSIEFTGHQIDYYIDYQGAIVSEEVNVLQYGSFPNNGKVSLSLVKTHRHRRNVKLQLIRSVFASGYFTSTSAITALIIIIGKKIATLHCTNWYDSQPSSAEMRRIVEVATQTRPCLPAIPSTFPDKIDNFVIDESCNPKSFKNNLMCNLFHPGAKGCYRSTRNEGAPAVQCCYSDDNKLLLGKPAGGTLDFADSEVSPMKHFQKDVLPYLTCCKLGVDQCDKYYEKRPSINPGIVRPPRSVNANGDPHFVTLDGTSYSFNPVGEFVYLTTLDSSDIIQARFSQYVDQNGVAKKASIFSGFSIKSKNSDSIQIELNKNQIFVFKINGQTMRLDFGFWSFNGISLEYENNATVVVQTDSKIRLEIVALNRALHAILSLSDTFKNRISGLVGDWDDNSSNDLKLPNGTFIPTNSSNEIIHFKFGMAWSTSNETTLFTYPAGLSWFDYQNRNFVPDFSTPTDHLQCKGNKDCNYDIQVTGNVNFGTSNIAIQKRLTDLKQTFQNVSQTCPSNLIVTNGNVKVRVVENTTHYSLICLDGFKLSGKRTSHCVSGSYSPIGHCDHPSNSNERLGIVSGLLIGCLIYNYVEQMRLTIKNF
ncbi:protein mesh-like [Hydra vulgaris]|uniref:Protein mesh-like n=1 Tax=Hydra vulgaris TaxID=6087 RepID=A0ABM4CR85_HYDVU